MASTGNDEVSKASTDRSLGSGAKGAGATQDGPIRAGRHAATARGAGAGGLARETRLEGRPGGFLSRDRHQRGWGGGGADQGKHDGIPQLSRGTGP
jgi:hypothetical protein